MRRILQAYIEKERPLDRELPEIVKVTGLRATSDASASMVAALALCLAHIPELHSLTDKIFIEELRSCPFFSALTDTLKLSREKQEVCELDVVSMSS